MSKQTILLLATLETMKSNRKNLAGVTRDQLQSAADDAGVGDLLDKQMPHLLNSFLVEIDGRFHFEVDCDLIETRPDVAPEYSEWVMVRKRIQ